MRSMRDARSHAKGKKVEVRTTVLARIPKKRSKSQILGIRKRLNVSQAVIARALNVSAKTIQAWEQGIREPSGPALKLLELVDRYPNIVMGWSPEPPPENEETS